MSTKKGMPKKATNLEERIDHLKIIAELMQSLEWDMDYLEKRASEAEENSGEWIAYWKQYNDKLWMHQRLEELAEEC